MHGFWAERRSSIWGIPAAPAGQKPVEIRRLPVGPKTLQRPRETAVAKEPYGGASNLPPLSRAVASPPRPASPRNCTTLASRRSPPPGPLESPTPGRIRPPGNRKEGPRTIPIIVRIDQKSSVARSSTCKFLGPGCTGPGPGVLGLDLGWIWVPNVLGYPGGVGA